MNAQHEPASDPVWPAVKADEHSPGQDGGSVLGRICEVCTFDESVVSFEPVPTSDTPVGTQCSGCGTLYDLAGRRA